MIPKVLFRPVKGKSLHLYLISVRVMGMVSRHCHRSAIDRFRIRTFLKKNNNYEPYKLFSTV